MYHICIVTNSWSRNVVCVLSATVTQHVDARNKQVTSALRHWFFIPSFFTLSLYITSFPLFAAFCERHNREVASCYSLRLNLEFALLKIYYFNFPFLIFIFSSLSLSLLSSLNHHQHHLRVPFFHISIFVFFTVPFSPPPLLFLQSKTYNEMCFLEYLNTSRYTPSSQKPNTRVCKLNVS